jgi:ribosomal protein S18 acetylase RimI-like enzyme
MPNYNIIKMNDYSNEQIAVIQSLEQLCKQFEESNLRVGIESLGGENGDHAFLCHADNQLIGFLSWYTSDGIEANIIGMVHPNYRRQGVFHSLLERAKKDKRMHGIETRRYRVPSDSKSGISCILHLKASFSTSEYSMKLADFRDKELRYPDLNLQVEEPGDLEFMVLCSSQAFGNSQSWTRKYFSYTREPNRITYIAKKNHTPVGLIRVNQIVPNTAVIHDFCVLPIYQGKGLGRDILASIIKLLLAEQRMHVRLGVVTQNKHALKLYQNVGFNTLVEFHYYVSSINE